MHRKLQKKQIFGTVDVATIIVLLGLVITVAGSILNEALRDDRSERAQLGAEALAHQMAAGGFTIIEAQKTIAASTVTETVAGRGPASVPMTLPSSQAVPALDLSEGTIGQDPWGNAFHYKVVRTEGGQPLHIFVWSSGPNAKAETRISDSDLARFAMNRTLPLGGDDVGFLLHNQ